MSYPQPATFPIKSNLLLTFSIYALIIFVLFNLSVPTDSYAADWQPLVTKGAYYDKDSIKLKYSKNKISGCTVWTKLPIRSNIHFLKYWLDCNKQKFQLLKGRTDQGYTYTSQNLYNVNYKGITRIEPSGNLGKLYKITCKKQPKPLIRVKLPFLNKKKKKD